MPKTGASLLSLRVVARGGAESDPPRMAGLSSVTANLLTRGTTTRTAEQFASQVDFLGAGIHSYVDPQSITIALDVLPANAPEAIQLLADAIRHPAFEETEVQREVALAMESARSHKDSASDAVWQYFRAFFFPPPHPYGRPFWGDMPSLDRIGRTAVARHYARIYTGRNLAITAVGPFDPLSLRTILQSAFGGLPAGKRYRWVKPPAPRSRSGRLLLVDKPDATQTQFVIGFPGIRRTHPDRIPLTLVNNILGGRFTSLLNERLRVESGLTYGAYSYVEEDRLNGALTIHSYAETADTQRAIDLALNVVRQFVAEGVSADQMAAARTYIEATYPPNHLQTAGQLADVIGQLELYELGRGEIDDLFARLDAVTIEQANRVLQQYYAGPDPVLALVGRAEPLRSQVQGRASTTIEISIAEPGFQPQGPAVRAKR